MLIDLKWLVSLIFVVWRNVDLIAIDSEKVGYLSDVNYSDVKWNESWFIPPPRYNMVDGLYVRSRAAVRGN